VNKSDVVNPYAVSCVENYFLAWCKESDIPVWMLFGTSFLPIQKVLDDFSRPDILFESYIGLPRVQEYSEKLGLTGHDYSEEITGLKKGGFDLLLMKVGKAFFEGYKRTPWRDDHYIAIKSLGADELLYLSSYPLEVGTLKTEEVLKVFGGSVLKYELKLKLETEVFNNDIDKQLETIIHTDYKAVNNCPDLKALRDAVMTLKISRARTSLWLKSLRHRFIYDAQFDILLARQKELYDKLFLKIGVAIVRNRLSCDFSGELSEIAALEYEISRGVKLRRLRNEQV